MAVVLITIFHYHFYEISFDSSKKMIEILSSEKYKLLIVVKRQLGHQNDFI